MGIHLHYVLSLFDPKPHSTNWRHILSCTVQTSSHRNRFPRRRDPNLARLAIVQCEPILALSFAVQEVFQPDRHIPKSRVASEVAVVDEFDGDDVGVLGGAEVFVGGFPAGVSGTFVSDGGEGGFGSIVDMDLCCWVELARGRFGGIEFLGLVNNEADNPNSCSRCSQNESGRWKIMTYLILQQRQLMLQLWLGRKGLRRGSS